MSFRHSKGRPGGGAAWKLTGMFGEGRGIESPPGRYQAITRAWAISR
jgi:hypothetical protein